MSLADFPISEFEARLERAQRAMHAQNLDALFFTTEAEMQYFTGFRTLFWQSPTRPWFLIIPRAGKPITIIPEIGADLMRTTWVGDIRTWASPHVNDDGVSLLRDALKDYARVGMMMGRESSLRMSLGDYIRVCEQLPGTTFHDASELVQSLRQIKSSGEIEKISAICKIASASFANAKDLFHASQPLSEAFRAFKIELLRQGAEDVPYLVGGAGQGGYTDVISPPTSEPLHDGDILMLDTGATLQGYFCDFDRNFAFGHASDAAKAAHDTLFRATDAAINAARPGTRCCDLYVIMADIIAQEGNDVGRFGHGLGLQLTEGVSLISFDETMLQEGMVITIEPSLTIEGNKIMVHEENIVIQDGAAKLLSERAPSELPIL